MTSTTYNQGLYNEPARSAAVAVGVPGDIYASLISQTSGWNPYSSSPTGIGLAQLPADRATSLGVNPWNPQENLTGGATYLKSLYDKFGNWRDALAAYNNMGAANADKILKNAGMVTPDDLKGLTSEDGPSFLAALQNPALFGDWLAAAFGAIAKHVGLVILGVILVALGVVLLVWKSGGKLPALPQVSFT